MKGRTKNLAEQVRSALLALSDTILMEALNEWLDGADEHIQYLDWSDEYRYALGYRVQSDETETIYASFDELDQAEPDRSCASWVVPNVETVRTMLSNSSTEQFYHTIIDLAGHGLTNLRHEEGWGSPPSIASDGYDFMRCLAVHLRYKAMPKPELGRIFFPKPAARKRKPLHPSHSGLPTWHLRPPHDQERTLSRDIAGEITKPIQPDDIAER